MRPFLPLLVAFVACSAQLQAQPGVRLGLIYGEGGARPGIFVLPVAGATGDSIRTIVMRDLDFGDRVTVLSKNTALPTPVGAAAVDFRAAARLGINGVVQITPAAGGVTITLHDVAAKQVLQRAVVILPGTPNTAAWRLAVHAASDQCEEWISGTGLRWRWPDLVGGQRWCKCAGDYAGGTRTLAGVSSRRSGRSLRDARSWWQRNSCCRSPWCIAAGARTARIEHFADVHTRRCLDCIRAWRGLRHGLVHGACIGWHAAPDLHRARHRQYIAIIQS